MANPTTKASTINLLVIEDNADQWYIIEWALRRCFPEIEPIWQPDAVRAMMYLESLADHPRKLPRLILLDLYLPGRETGWNLLQILKNHALYRNIPVVMLSYSADKEDILESYTQYSNSYIVKPSGYEKWLECFADFRRYWWEFVTLPRPV